MTTNGTKRDAGDAGDAANGTSKRPRKTSSADAANTIAGSVDLSSLAAGIPLDAVHPGLDATVPHAPGRAITLSEEQTKLALRNALGHLSDRHREVVESIYLQGRTYDETAAELQKPRGTINRLQREAMKQLRDILFPDS